VPRADGGAQGALYRLGQPVELGGAEPGDVPILVEVAVPVVARPVVALVERGGGS
jgi:hypothetical protein